MISVPFKARPPETELWGLLHSFLDVFLPPLCLLCDSRLLDAERYVCAQCWASLPVFPDRSARPFRALRGSLDRLWIGWSYREQMRRIVHLFKYEGRPELASLLISEWRKAVSHADGLDDIDLLLPVPIHPARRRWRGYNQSDLLAQHLGNFLHKPVVSESAIRVINTPSQTHLDREERWQSVAEAFQVQRPAVFCGKNVLIVDDLATSGATLHALAATLRGCQVRSVSAAVLTSPELGTDS